TVSPSSTTTYTITSISDANCSGTSSGSATVTVNTPAQATISASGATSFCPGGSVTLTASGGASYLWSTGATVQAINVSSGGRYPVPVPDANGCSSTSADTLVTVYAPPTAVVSGGGAYCVSGSATISATLTGTAPFAITWSDGVNQNVSGTSASRTVS